jgi:probable rRNA maturation factor
MIFLKLETKPDFSEDLLTKAAQSTLEETTTSDADLTIVLTSDEEIRALNRDFIGNDAPTDVLSFPAGETDPDTGRHYLGDVVISLPRATEQATERGHSLEAESQLLVVHGVLHLLGYDHADAPDKIRMWAAQVAVLDILGLAEIKIED